MTLALNLRTSLTWCIRLTAVVLVALLTTVPIMPLLIGFRNYVDVAVLGSSCRSAACRLVSDVICLLSGIDPLCIPAQLMARLMTSVWVLVGSYNSGPLLGLRLVNLWTVLPLLTAHLLALDGANDLALRLQLVPADVFEKRPPRTLWLWLASYSPQLFLMLLIRLFSLLLPRNDVSADVTMVWPARLAVVANVDGNPGLLTEKMILLLMGAVLLALGRLGAYEIVLLGLTIIDPIGAFGRDYSGP